ncbi:hypothetical protein PG993_008052 [Apiospora rasikravindrae]|uniref:Cyanovirin-N domain-containing protein n=1 Tax=Apiospora rasikravindrae TaxID=990691 RepID=A0ABR1SZ94_9PEZI
MRISVITTTLFSTLAVVQGGFLQTCKDPSMIEGGLEASCRTASGSWRHSRLSLNSCLANDNGVLVWRKNGGAMSSCRYGRPQTGRYALCWSCDMRGGSTDFDCVELGTNVHRVDDRINNQDGRLECFGIAGS